MKGKLFAKPGTLVMAGLSPFSRVFGWDGQEGPPRRFWQLVLLSITAAASGWFLGGEKGTAWAIDHVLFKQDGELLSLSGRILVEGQDGSLLLETRDTRYWVIPPEVLVNRRRDEEPFRFLSYEELVRQFRQELGEAFSVRRTANYLILYNCGESYAAWCGWLLERLYMAFTTFWSRRGVPIRQPETPLVAIIFPTNSAFVQYARKDAGEAAAAIIGYYHLEKNFTVLYDLTETSAVSPSAARRSLAEINRLLAHPEAYRAVATIVHEATHQLCYNTGLFSRLTENPLWLAEGIAMFFETPDLQSTAGWRSVGEVNPKRLEDFHKLRARGGGGSLLSLIRSDDRFRETTTALEAYAEAWALCYFLLRRYPQKMASYVKLVGQRPPMETYPATRRVEDFEQNFGPLPALEAEFLRFMERVR
jgi:hypothetical protein